MNSQLTPGELQTGYQETADLVRENVKAIEDIIEPKLSGAQRKRLARQGTLVKLAIAKPRRRKVRLIPDVQIARGPITSETYQAIRDAYKRRVSVRYQQRFYRVAYVRTNEVGNFEARLVEAV